jgi:hypothetical protein
VSSESTYIGGLRWRVWGWMAPNATWPLVKLILRQDGVTLEPHWRGLRFLGIPTVQADWGEVESVERIRGALMGSPEISFVVKGQRFVFWSGDALRRRDDAEEILRQVAQYAPEKVMTRDQPKRVLW